jgi:hypothetical protein
MFAGRTEPRRAGDPARCGAFAVLFVGLVRLAVFAAPRADVRAVALAAFVRFAGAALRTAAFFGAVFFGAAFFFDAAFLDTTFLGATFRVVALRGFACARPVAAAAACFFVLPFAGAVAFFAVVLRFTDVRAAPFDAARLVDRAFDFAGLRPLAAAITVSLLQEIGRRLEPPHRGGDGSRLATRT